ncbi:hypothetical protein D806_028680 [Mycolicibacterium smegmatis MKD8]|uniref:Uncharacterized protein n=1 Tax=Mycolicibacterium smegmatis (strain MKD8) TaxID=1214915 RepID=A0A2U9PQ12_MYCSE|nr:hypothetical protein D806_028680 [Mycolicibacterium smegmatis MKD8]
MFAAGRDEHQNYNRGDSSTDSRGRSEAHSRKAKPSKWQLIWEMTASRL